MTIIYLVYQGYTGQSDFSVIAAFSSEELAEKFIDICPSTDYYGFEQLEVDSICHDTLIYYGINETNVKALGLEIE